jgi:Predicted dehydrogenases and related proteins
MKKMSENEDFKVGIVGAGWIAEKAAITLNGLEGFRPYAIGSRLMEKAKSFADKWGIERAYASYSEVIDDPEVESAVCGHAAFASFRDHEGGDP